MTDESTLQKSQWRIDYEEYLSTSTWRAKRNLVMARAGGQCEGCCERAATQVHHRNYPKDESPGSDGWITREKLFDLVALCDKCHADVHFGGEGGDGSYAELTDIIRFGQYGGRTVREMLVDQSYCRWFLSQPDFRARYPGLFAIVANRGVAAVPAARPPKAAEPSPAFRLACFGDVVALARQEGDLQLAQALERNVRVERFEEGGIAFSLVGDASSSIAQTLSRRLMEWTGERWMATEKMLTNAAALGVSAFPVSTAPLPVLMRATYLAASRGCVIDLGEIPLDDSRTYTLLGRSETVGVFQLEGGCMRKALAGARPDRFDDLVALVVKFADRGFNKGYAAAYALLTYWTAFFKANYPVELLAALSEAPWR